MNKENYSLASNETIIELIRESQRKDKLNFKYYIIAIGMSCFCNLGLLLALIRNK